MRATCTTLLHLVISVISRKRYPLWSPSQSKESELFVLKIDNSVFESRKVQLLSSTVLTRSLRPNHVVVQCVRVTTVARTKRPECETDNWGTYRNRSIIYVRTTFILTNNNWTAKMGRKCNTGYSSIEHQKLDSLCPRSCKMEKRRWEGQNSQKRKLSAWWRRIITIGLHVSTVIQSSSGPSQWL